MNYLRKLLFILAISMVFGVSAMAANTGDLGISYKNNTAYLIATEGEGADKVETWVLRSGSQAAHDQVEVYMKEYRIMGIHIFYNAPNEGWHKRSITKLGLLGRDSGWFRITDKQIEAEGLTSDIVIKVKYMSYSEHYETFGFHGVGVIEFETKTKAFIEGMIWDMTWSDYNDGQEGR